VLYSLIIYPGFKASYYSYYIQGLIDAVPGAKFTFSTSGFPRLHHHCLAFILNSRRIYISAGDGTGVGREALDWCDVYAKVNWDPTMSHVKLFAIGPSFGIQFLPLWRGGLWAVRSYFGGAFRLNRGREHFAEYWRQWRHRLPIGAYEPGTSEADYAFSLSRLWKNEPKTNLARANFIRACRSSPGLRFEGGLVRRSDVSGFDDVTVSTTLAYPDYVARTRASLVVFNTPAVCGCLGWKLAEFLAFGKAIISTPLHRALPAPLQHGVHLHYVDGSVESIRDALHVLRSKPDYRLALERAARDYYDAYLAPVAVVRRVLGRAQIDRIGGAS